MLDFMSSVLNFIYSLGPFLLLISVLIFIHELGHFAAARWCGVHIETFSIGFGPKLLKYTTKKGERFNTTYCFSIIPLGGFVKMFGDDPLEEVEAQYKHLAFTKKSYWQKVFIAAAGPLMNAAFAAVAFFILAYSGTVAEKPTLGDLKITSAAYSQGARAGDLITAINDKKIQSWSEVKLYVENKINKTITLHMQTSHSKEPYSLELKVMPKKNSGFSTLKKTIGSLELEKKSRSPLIATSPNSEGRKQGLPPFFVIKKINHRNISYFREIKEALTEAGTTGTLKIQYVTEKEPAQKNKSDSGSKTKKRKLAKSTSQEKPKSKTAIINMSSLPQSSKPVFERLELGNPEVYVYSVNKGSAAEKAGILAGDKILKLNNKTLTGWGDFSEIQKIKSQGKELKVTWQRPSGDVLTKIVNPEIQEVLGQGVIEKKWIMGIQNYAAYVNPSEIKAYYNSSVFSALGYGLRQTVSWSKYIAVSFFKLLTNQISPRNISGIITIGAIASNSYDRGFSVFMKIMAIISINLFILNLIPIPVLDGGHIFIFTIEAIYGKPLNARLLLIAQSSGALMLVGILIFSLFNDIVNLFF